MSSGYNARERPPSLNLLAGSLAGATATVMTYPLDVLQTRLQSSTLNLKKVSAKLPMFVFERNVCLTNMRSSATPVRNATLVSYAKAMIQNEGYSLLSRGLPANVVAFSLSKGIYFTVYSYCKNFLRPENLERGHKTVYIHVCSAAFAGFTSCTLTNPVWFIKTRLQLESRDKPRSKLLKIPVTIYQNEGIRAFYSGLTASYLGIAETVIYFVIYEYLRSIIWERRQSKPTTSSSICGTFHVSDCVIASAVSKTIATVLAYPHEVVRTRMREHQNKQKSFSRLIRTILHKEGWQGFYGGLATHLIRQVPNTIILFLTYESVLYFGTQVMKTRT